MAIPGLSPVRALVALAAIAMLSLSSCTTKVTDINDAKGQENFVKACQSETKIQDGAQVTTPLASESFCKCVIDKLLNKYKISNDTFKEFQDRIDKGDDFTPPAEVTKSMQDCTPAGPEGPSTTSTTAPPG